MAILRRLDPAFVESHLSRSRSSEEAAKPSKIVPSDSLRKFFLRGRPHYPLDKSPVALDPIKRSIEPLDLELKAYIDKGVSSTVFKVEDAKNKVLALKVYRSEISNMVFKEECQALTLAQELIPHHVVQCVKIIDSKDLFGISFRAILLSYYAFTLQSLLNALYQAELVLPLEHVNKLTYDLLTSLKGIQTHLSHMDLKTANIFVEFDAATEKLSLRLGDFSCVQFVDRMIPGPHVQLLNVRSPNILRLIAKNNDIFSAGCLLFEILTGELLFPYAEPSDQDFRKASEAYKCVFKLPLQQEDIFLLLKNLQHLQKVFHVTHIPSDAFIKELGLTSKLSVFYQEQSDGAFVFRGELSNNPNYIKDRLATFRKDLNENEKEAYANLILMMLEYESPPNPADVMNHPVFCKESSDQDPLIDLSQKFGLLKVG